MAEKTEAPTPRRLADARERGQVVRSHELNVAVALVVGIWLLTGPGKNLTSALTGLIRQSVVDLPTYEITEGWLRQMAYNDLTSLALPMGEIVLGLLVIGVGVTLVQTGLSWASKRPFWDFSRVNPMTGVKRIFSLNGVVEVIKSLLKLVVVGCPVYSYLSANIQQIIRLVQMDLRSGVAQWVSLAVSVMWRVATAYLVLAVADYVYQRWQFMRNMRMTKQEVLEDVKRSEGDPFLRGRIRQQQRRLARSRMMARVPKADVVVTNPTHLAIAIQYDGASMSAPKVLAKGSHLIAERIVKLARENQIPVVQNIPLARAIYRSVDLEEEIPADLYLAMAEVLAYVYRLKGKAQAAAG